MIREPVGAVGQADPAGQGPAMTDSSYDASSLPEDAANVLVLGTPGDRATEEACVDLLTVGPAGRTDLLFVTVTEPARARIDAWRGRAGDQPAKVGVVSVDERGRSTARTPADDFSVQTVGEPGDLTGLGIAVTEYLSEWHDDGNRTVLCFRSVTALLQYVGARRAYKFLNELTSRLSRVEAVAHFHLDPSAHDEQTVNTLVPLFDAVVDPTGDRTPPTAGADATVVTGSDGEPATDDRPDRDAADSTGSGPDAPPADDAADRPPDEHATEDTREPTDSGTGGFEFGAPGPGGDDATAGAATADEDAPEEATDGTTEDATDEDAPEEATDGPTERTTDDGETDGTATEEPAGRTSDGAAGGEETEAPLPVVEPSATEPDEATAGDAGVLAGLGQGLDAAGTRRVAVAAVVVALLTAAAAAGALPGLDGARTIGGDGGDGGGAPAAGMADGGTDTPTTSPTALPTATHAATGTSGTTAPTGASSTATATAGADGTTTDDASGGVTGAPAATDTVTPTPTATATATPAPTATPTEGDVLDTVTGDDDDDGVLDTPTPTDDGLL